MARRRAEPVNRHWTPFSHTFLAASAGSVAATLFPAQHDRETIMRTRGNLICYADTTQAPGGLVQIDIGLIQVPEGTGTTVLWAPLTDGDAPWLFHESFFIGYEECVTDVIDVPGITSFRSVIDNKAMRRIRNQELQIVLENTTAGTAMAVNAAISGRQLTQE